VASQRKKRTPPEQNGPKRTSAPAVAPPSGNGAARNGPYSYGEAIDRGLEAARLVVDAVDATARGAVERGVETAYAVIDEYMRRGRTAASQRHNSGSAYTATFGGAVQPPGGGYPGGSAGGGASGANSGPWGNASTNPLLAPWLQMMRLWTDSMMAFMPTGGANPFAMWTGAMQPRPAIAVRTSSQHPVEVTVSLDAGAEWFLLRADPLVSSESPNSSSIAAPSIACEPGRVSVSVAVPSAQPAGRYTATIRDSAGVRRGELCVSVDAASPMSATQPI
jgi:hypothetical protein